MIRRRVRIRFRKEDDLRWISHRDLVRALERLVRRAGLTMSMSEGFHPKPRMSFPAALGLGMTGLDELAEIELAEELSADAIRAALAPHCPPGLVLQKIEVLPEGARKARVRSMSFELPLPATRRQAVAARIAAILPRDAAPAVPDGGAARVDLGPEIEQWTLADDRLSIRLRVNPQGGARPRAVLEALGLDDLQEQGIYLTRTAVELEP